MVFVESGQTFLLLCAFLLACYSEASANRNEDQLKEIAIEAYIWGYPAIMNYKTMFSSIVESCSTSDQHPFNRLIHHNLSTPNDNGPSLNFVGLLVKMTTKGTTFVTPNVDTLYSFGWLDLRAEPVVLCVPIMGDRYYTIQLIDLYGFNVDFIGTRKTGNFGGCYLVKHIRMDYSYVDMPKISNEYRSETEFILALYRTEVQGGANDLRAARDLQRLYKIHTLSDYLNLATQKLPLPDFPVFNETEALTTGYVKYLNFLLTYCFPVHDDEKELRKKFELIGIEPGKSYNYEKLDEKHKAAIDYGYQFGSLKISWLGILLNNEYYSYNGWAISKNFGNRTRINGNWLNRAAGALYGLYGCDIEEAMYYSSYYSTVDKMLLHGSQKYRITFKEGQLPPVQAFWSITMYDVVTKTLVSNALRRYAINSSMVSQSAKNNDSSVTIYIQHKSPGKHLENNWLPCGKGSFYMILRLYLPEPAAVAFAWIPPVVEKIKM